MHGTSPTRIGLMICPSQGYGRAVLRWVRAYGEARPDWVFTTVPVEAPRR